MILYSVNRDLCCYEHHDTYDEHEKKLYCRWIDGATNDNYRNRDSAAACDPLCNYTYINRE